MAGHLGVAAAGSVVSGDVPDGESADHHRPIGPCRDFWPPRGELFGFFFCRLVDRNDFLDLPTAYPGNGANLVAGLAVTFRKLS